MKAISIAGRRYVQIGKDILATPHLLRRAEERGVNVIELLEKLKREQEAIKDYVASCLGRDRIRGYFYLTFSGGRRGKIVWEVMSKKGKRCESLEEVEDDYCYVVFYTYLSREQVYRA